MSWALVAVTCSIAACTSERSGAAVTTATSTATTSTTGAATSVEETDVASSAPATTLPRLDVVGATLDAVWDVQGVLQQYYLDGVGTGLYSGTRIPVNDAAPGGLWLALAERSGVGLRRDVFTAPFDGAAMLLSGAGSAPHERYLVEDGVSIEIPAGEGLVVTARCEGGQRLSHVLVLRFGATGPVPVQAWHIEQDAHLLPVDPSTTGCDGFTGGPAAADGSGMLVVDTCCLPGSGPTDIGGPSPRPSGFVTRGGLVVGTDRSLSMMVRGDEEWFWLEQLLGYVDTGTPITRVLATQALPSLAERAPGEIMQTDCRRADGAMAVGLSGGRASGNGANAVPSVAWVLDVDAARFVPTDPAGVTCVNELGD